MAKMEIVLGALCDSIADHVKAAGMTVGALDAVRLQQDGDAITRLSVRGFITPSQAHTARKRLVKDIASACHLVATHV